MLRFAPMSRGTNMWRFAKLARFLAREGLCAGLDMLAGTYYEAPSIYDDRNFPEPWDPSDVGGGYGGGG